MINKQVLITNINSKKMTFLSIYLIELILLSYIYYSRIFPIFSYSGFLMDLNIMKLVIGIFVLVIIIFYSIKDKDRPSYFIFHVLLAINYVPVLVLFWMSNYSYQYFFLLSFSYLILNFITLKKTRLDLFKNSLSRNDSQFIFVILFILYVLLTIYLVIDRGGFDSRAFNFNLIYDLRDEYSLSGIEGYLFNWTAKVLFPLFLVITLYKRKFLISLLSILSQIALYLAFGIKSILFSVILIPLVYLVAKKNRNYLVIFLILIVSGIVAAHLLDTFQITTFLRQNFVYRIFFIPAKGQFQYFYFFQENPFLYLSEGRIGRLLNIEYPYHDRIGIVVNQYFRGYDFFSNGNTGIFSYAYADGGFLSMFIFSVLFGFILKIVDYFTKYIDIRISASLFSYSIFIINDNSFVISMWTGGILLLIIMIVLFEPYILTNHTIVQKKGSNQ